MKGFWWRGTLCTLAAVGCLSGAEAQKPPSVYAIVGARIELGGGRVLEKGTLVLRNGTIEAVGADIKPPAEAEVIAGEGLVVYPGFIDAWSSAGLTLPDPKPVQDVAPDTSLTASPSMREANRKGIRPELRASDYLSLTDGQLSGLRSNGFTTQLIFPTGGMMNGQGVLLNLSGRPRREVVLSRALGTGFAFNSGGFGGYPSSQMGVIAHLRQTLLDAQYLSLQSRAFEQSGGVRPPADDVLEALQVPLSGKQSVFFEAETEAQIVRALKLTEEFRLPLVLCGGSEAFLQIERLQKSPKPILLSLNFGKEPSAEESKDIPKAALAEQKRKWEERVANAITLYKAKIPFAFTTKGLKSPNEFWENLRRVMKAGLPREVALNALTGEPARILGVERLLGTIAVGKTVALTVMNGDFADPKTKVVSLFIDKERFEPGKDASTTTTTPTRPTRRPRMHDHDDDPNLQGSR